MPPRNDSTLSPSTLSPSLVAHAANDAPTVFDHLRATIVLGHDDRPLRAFETARTLLTVVAYESPTVSPGDFGAALGWLTVEAETQLSASFPLTDGPAMRAHLRALTWLDSQPATPIFTFARRWVAGWTEITHGERSMREGDGAREAEAIARAAMSFTGAVEALAAACGHDVDRVLEAIDEGELLGPSSSSARLAAE